MPHIVILDGHTVHPGDNSWEPIERLGTLAVYDRTPVNQVVERARRADIVLTNKTVISANAIRQLPQLKFIGVLATGYNVVDVETAERHNIAVANVPEYGSRTVAQFTWALILELCHHVGRHAGSVNDGHWTSCPDFCYWHTCQIELAGLNLGLVGYGRIARHVGEIAHAFGMHVLACGRPVANPQPSPNVNRVALDELVAAADIVSLHCPLTPHTEQMINLPLLNRMRRSALLVNTSRGGLVNEAHLAQALEQELIAGAAVDVVSREPIQADNPLLCAPNCLITPHMAWTSVAARKRIVNTTAQNIAAFLNGTPQNVVTDQKQ